MRICFVSLGASQVKNLSASVGHTSWILGKEDTLEEEMATHSCMLSGVPTAAGNALGVRQGRGEPGWRGAGFGSWRGFNSGFNVCLTKFLTLCSHKLIHASPGHRWIWSYLHGGGGWSHGEDAAAQRNRESEKNGGSEQNAESLQTS